MEQQQALDLIAQIGKSHSSHQALLKNLESKHRQLFKPFKDHIKSFIDKNAIILKTMDFDDAFSSEQLKRMIAALLITGNSKSVAESYQQTSLSPLIRVLPAESIVSLSDWTVPSGIYEWAPTLQELQQEEEEKKQVTYIPLRDLAIDNIKQSTTPEDKYNCLQYQNYYTNRQPFAAGTYGSIHDVCKDAALQECPYVAKVIHFRDNCSHQSFFVEQAISKRASDKGYGVPVLDSFFCNDRETGVIIYEKFDNDLVNFAITPAHLSSLLEKVHDMHDDGIFHQDLFTKNVLYKKHADNTIDIRITDFGLSIPVETKLDAVLRACDLVTILYGLMTVELGLVLLPVYTNMTLQDVTDQALRYVSSEELLTAIHMRESTTGTVQDPYKYSGKLTTDPLSMYTLVTELLPSKFRRVVGQCIDDYFVWQNVDTVSRSEQNEVDHLVRDLQNNIPPRMR